MPSVPGVLSGCSFGNASTQVLGGSSFVLTEPELGSVVLPFTFRWTVSDARTPNIFLYPSSDCAISGVNPITITIKDGAPLSCTGMCLVLV